MRWKTASSSRSPRSTMAAYDIRIRRRREAARAWLQKISIGQLIVRTERFPKKTMSASPARKSAARRALPSHSKTSIVVKVANQQRRGTVSDKRLRSAIQSVLAGEGYDRADISLAVVNDATIHDINRRYLNHDEPTDVISFVLDQADGF